MSSSVTALKGGRALLLLLGIVAETGSDDCTQLFKTGYLVFMQKGH